jgi:hypothetical protein
MVIKRVFVRGLRIGHKEISGTVEAASVRKIEVCGSPSLGFQVDARKVVARGFELCAA